MRYLAAFALAFLSGKANPSAADVKKILTAAGADIDESKIKAICDALGGQDIAALVADKVASMASIPSGAGAAGASSGAAEAKVEEAAPVEEEEEEEDDFGFDLFG